MAGDLSSYKSSQAPNWTKALWDGLIDAIAARLAPLEEQLDVQKATTDAIVRRGLEVIELLLAPQVADASAKVADITAKRQEALDLIAALVADYATNHLAASQVDETDDRKFVTTATRAEIRDSAVALLRDGIDPAGDTLSKLYALVGGDIAAAIDALKAGVDPAYDTLQEIAAKLADDDTAIGGILTAIGRRLRFDAAQALTLGEKTQARANLGLDVLLAQNWIINGDFSVAVRGNTKTPGTGIYGFDRWKGTASGLVQRVYGLPAGTYTLAWDGGGNATFNGVTAASPIVSTWAGGNADIVVPATADKVCLVPGDRSGETGLFKARPYLTELGLCRHFWRRTSAGLTVRAYSASKVFISEHIGPMRAMPTASMIAGSGAGGVSYVGGATANVLSIGGIVISGSADDVGYWLDGNGTFESGGWYVVVNNMVALDADA